MILLGRDWMLSDFFQREPMVHRTRVFRDRDRWWWTCRDCEHLGTGNSWPRILASAERHVLGRRIQ